MKNSDVELIQRTLAGDQRAFSTLVREVSKAAPRPCMAKNRRLPHR